MIECLNACKNLIIMVLHDSYMAKDFYCVASYAIHTFANMRSKCNRENKEGQNDIGTLLCLYSFD